MEETFSKEESLSLITKMIAAAKREQQDNGIKWIVWGWILFIISIVTVINLKYQWVNTGFFWNAFGGFVLLYFAFTIIRRLIFTKSQKVKTYTKDLLTKLNTGFFICLLFIILSMNLQQGNNEYVNPFKGFALLINLYGFWILIYGTALNFKPSVYASFIVWAIGIVSMIVATFEAVMLLHAAAVLTGYILPGHLAYNEFKKLQRKKKA